MEGALRIIDRDMILADADHALAQHQWLTAPDFDQEGEVQAAAKKLQSPAAAAAPLLCAAYAMHAWLSLGGTRAPFRAALIRYWRQHRLLRAPVPLTGPRALGADIPFDLDTWVPIFLVAVAEEAADGLHMLQTLERSWFAAPTAVSVRRPNSRAGRAVDILAAAPVISATSLAAGLGMAPKNAITLLEEFQQAGNVVKVTHRSKRRSFGLAGLAPLREQFRPPRRPEPDRGRGRPPNTVCAAEVEPPTPAPEQTLTPFERKAIDYSALTHWMAHADGIISKTRRSLDALARTGIALAFSAGRQAPVLPMVSIAESSPDHLLGDHPL